MSRNRTNLKIDPDTRDRLAEQKRDGETWDDCLTRLAEYGRLVELDDE